MRVKGTFKGQNSFFPSPLTLSLFLNGDKRLIHEYQKLVNKDKRLIHEYQRLVNEYKRLDDKKSSVGIAIC